MLKRKIWSLFLIMFSFSLFAQEQHVGMGAEVLKINGKSILAITFENDKDWHTYWKNPGDAGLAVRLKFNNNGSPVELSDYPWPAPKRYIEQGNMWAYGYSGKYAQFFDLNDSFKKTQLNIVGEWLVCKDICIPGTRTLNLDLNQTLDGKKNNILDTSKLKDIFKNLPQHAKSKHINFFLTKGQKENQLALHYIIENADFSKIKDKASIVTPYVQAPFDYKHEELYLDKKTNTIFGRIYIDWDGLFEEPEWPLPLDGVFKTGITVKLLIQYPSKNRPTIVTKTFNEFTLTGDKALTAQFKNLDRLGETSKKSLEGSIDQNEQSLFIYILFAFLGGLILNLMPCVLPVISLKLFGLIIHSNESKKQILKHNLAYTAGVLASFLSLAVVVMLLKSSGDQIGWGFQLQSPLFVFIMLMVIFIMALNMLGLFEFGTPGGKTLGNQEIKKGIWPDFVNGILATILSTPCSAPFLGTALTFAFTTSYLNIFIIFTSVGVGLAFPFILTGFFPRLIKFLPKPGLWMDKLKKFLGLSLILTVVWLVDVLFSIIDFGYVGITFNALLAFTFFAFYFRSFISKKMILNILVFSLPLLLAYQVGKLTLSPESNIGESKRYEKGATQWKKWTPDITDNSNGKFRFINFTASWCLTCKVNKKLVLGSSDFKDLVKSNQIELYEGDWTKRDDNITRFLAKYKIVGVPAYFIQKPNGEIISLGETISIGKIEKNLK